MSLAVDAAEVAYAIGRVLDHPDTTVEFWELIAELDAVVPTIDWHNLATDAPARGPRCAPPLVEAECGADGGHSYDVIVQDRHGHPTRIVCGACPASWDVAGPTRRTHG